MNESRPNLVTTYTFKGGREYVTKMRVTASRGGSQRNLELSVTDKYTSENWQSSYDSAYIENLTHKTGNHKQFDVFVTMLQSGLLKTSDSVTLDLLTFEDLEMLRARRSEVTTTSSSMGCKGSNRRYLILTYTVEFDRIHYPLPLEYCGLPDPSVLQATIRKLTVEIERLRTTGINKDLEKRIEVLAAKNRQLQAENKKLSSDKGGRRLSCAIKALENNVSKERASFRAQIQKLRAENASLSLKVRQLTETAGRKSGGGSPAARRRSPASSSQNRRPQNRKPRSRSSSASGRFKASSLSSGSSLESLRLRDSSRPRVTRSYHFGAKEIDFENLEARIQALQKMLKEGINLN